MERRSNLIEERVKMQKFNDDQLKWLWNTARKKGISRRDFFKLISTGGIAAILAACTQENGRMAVVENPSETKPFQFSPTKASTSATPTTTPTSTLTPPPPKSIPEKIVDRSFPSVFMAWNMAGNFTSGFPKDGAQYDLIITHEWQFELCWNARYPGQGISFQPECLKTGQSIHDTLLGNNPNALVMAEVRYRDAAADWLPEDSSMWQRDSSGKRIPGWGNYYMLDWRTPSARSRIADQAKAFVHSGIYDGIMFDWWDDRDPDRIRMLEAARDAIGQDKLIIVNSGINKAPNAAPLVNGLYMEAAFYPHGYPADSTDWRTISNTLLWAEENLRNPRINALETWCEKTHYELNRMRATTTLALTHSNGYALFADKNHYHWWESFWGRKELGKPAATMIKRSDGAFQREFSGGTVVYNPMGNHNVISEFPDERVSAANGQRGHVFPLESMDGDLYLKLP
jgi:hypothetical protein